MKIGEEIWKELKSEIERLLTKDSNITDLIINYQIKKTKVEKQYAKIKIK